MPTQGKKRASTRRRTLRTTTSYGHPRKARSTKAVGYTRTRRCRTGRRRRNRVLTRREGGNPKRTGYGENALKSGANGALALLQGAGTLVQSVVFPVPSNGKAAAPVSDDGQAAAPVSGDGQAAAKGFDQEAEEQASKEAEEQASKEAEEQANTKGNNEPKATTQPQQDFVGDSGSQCQGRSENATKYLQESRAQSKALRTQPQYKPPHEIERVQQRIERAQQRIERAHQREERAHQREVNSQQIIERAQRNAQQEARHKTETAQLDNTLGSLYKSVKQMGPILRETRDSIQRDSTRRLQRNQERLITAERIKSGSIVSLGGGTHKSPKSYPKSRRRR